MAGGDWITFFEQAQRLAAQIRSAGWSASTVRFEGQWPASLMAAAFAFTGRETPLVVLPVYAATYALAALALHGVARRLGLKGGFALEGLAVLDTLIYSQTV